MRGHKKLDFPANLVWLNLTESIYKKKPPFVLIFFSRRYITDIQGIANRFQCEKVAVFSPESEGEKNEKTIVSIVNRFNVKIPVAIDLDRILVNSLSVSKLPAVVITDDDSNVVSKIQGGEEIFNHFFSADGGRLVEQVSGQKSFLPDKNKAQDFTFYIPERGIYKDLYFPTKIAYHRDTKLIAISNTGKKEVLVLNNFCELIYIIGSERQYQKDFGDVRFEHPEGICFSEDGRFLLICDYLRHSISIVDIEMKMVTGKVNLPFPKSISRGDGEFIVVSHIGKIFRVNKEILEGGEPEIQEVRGELDFPYYAMCRDGGVIVADSGDDSIKEIGRGMTRVLAGGNGGGHKDGPALKSLFQSPCSLEVYRDAIFIADMLNNAIRVLFENTVSTMTIVNAELFEPEDVKIVKGSIMICDTGNHRILYVEPMSGKAEELQIGIV